MKVDSIGPLERNIPAKRISAYECERLPTGEIVKGRYVKNGGWYGSFTVEKLHSEIMPNLAKYAARGWSYPFLITSHQLEKETEAHINYPLKGKAKVSDLNFGPRKRKTGSIPVAIVFSTTQASCLVNYNVGQH